MPKRAGLEAAREDRIERMTDGERRAMKVTVNIEYEDGGTHEMRFFHLDEPFDVSIEYRQGSPKAQLGGVVITLPRWPAVESKRPANEPPPFAPDLSLVEYIESDERPGG